MCHQPEAADYLPGHSPGSGLYLCSCSTTVNRAVPLFEFRFLIFLYGST
jgi:hypothetical protein